MNITTHISEQLISDTIVSAIEGGIRYWCNQVTVKSPDRLCVAFRETDGGEVFELTGEDWPRVVALMATKAPRHFANLVRETGDAETADVLVQFGCFGEIKYG